MARAGRFGRWTAAAVCVTALFLSATAGTAFAKGSKFGAWDVCSQFVVDRLKAPSTSDIAEYGDKGTSVTKVAKTYTVIAHVDAENSFGAQIRTDYICSVRYLSGRSYHLVDLQFDDGS